ncbi:MAG: C4-type zinc ribbon domain-containing protein [Polyangiaceae bacterium]
MTAQDKLAQQTELLEALAEVDAEIKKLDAQIGEDQGGLDTLRRDRARLEEKLSSDRTAFETMQTTLKDLGTEIRQMTNRVERSREKLGRSRTERESQAAEREVDELRKLIQDRQEESNKLQTLADAARKSIDEGQAALDKVLAELAANEDSTSERIREVSAAREKALKMRSDYGGKLPSAILRRYDTVRVKRGSGVARLVNGTCSACHISLSPSLAQKMVRREGLEACPSCQRLIYWAPPVEANQESAG